MKNLIFDSSAIINLTMNGLLDILLKLKKEFSGKFLITDKIEYEIVTRPMNTIKKYELEALKIREIINEKIIEISSFDRQKFSKETELTLNFANHIFSANGEWIKIIHDGEASCLALSKLLGDAVIVVDERTTRLLGEDPEKLRKILERKLHMDIKMNKDNLDFFKNHKFIRSAELVYVAWKKNLIGIKDGKQLLDALLYGVKYKGCAISEQEIEEIKKL